jgi:hypothetical protein
MRSFGLRVRTSTTIDSPPVAVDLLPVSRSFPERGMAHVRDGSRRRTPVAFLKRLTWRADPPTHPPAGGGRASLANAVKTLSKGLTSTHRALCRNGTQHGDSYRNFNPFINNLATDRSAISQSLVLAIYRGFDGHMAVGHVTAVPSPAHVATKRFTRSMEGNEGKKSHVQASNPTDSPVPLRPRTG